MASINKDVAVSVGLEFGKLSKDMQIVQNKMKGFEVNVTNVGNRFDKAFKQAARPLQGTTYAVTNLNRVISDMPYGLIGVANNLDPLMQSFQKLQKQAGSTTGALKALLVGAFTGPGALLTLTSAIPAAFIIYDKFFKDTADSAAKATKKITDFTSEFTKLINTSISDQGVKGIEAQMKKVDALNELWLEQTPTQERLRAQIEGVDRAIKLMNNSTKGLTEEQNRVLLGLVDQKKEYEQQIKLSEALKSSLVGEIAEAESQLLAMKMAQSSETIKSLKVEQSKTEELRRQFALIGQIQRMSLKVTEPGNAKGQAESTKKTTKSKYKLDAQSLVDENVVRGLQQIPSTTASAAEAIDALSNNQMRFLQAQLQATRIGVDAVGHSIVDAFVDNIGGIDDFSDAFSKMGDVVKDTLKSMVKEFIRLGALSAFKTLLGGVGFAPGFIATAFNVPTMSFVSSPIVRSTAAKTVINNQLQLDGRTVFTNQLWTDQKRSRITGTKVYT